MEDTLVRIASRYIEQFAAIHQGKNFYGFAFDCNADYGQILICANSLDGLRAQASDYKARRPELEIQQLEDELRWSLGDWEFNGFTTEGFSKAWNPIEELIAGLPVDDDQRLEEIRRECLEPT